MVHLRTARKEDREEIPLHFEGCGLVSWAAVPGWIGGGLASVLGVVLMLRLAGTNGDIAGAVLAAAGMCLLVAAVRCRRHETVVGEQWLKTSCGPFRNELRRSLVRGVCRQPATGWRRLYAREELVLELEGDLPGPLLPSNEPGELIDLLAPERRPKYS